MSGLFFVTDVCLGAALLLLSKRRYQSLRNPVTIFGVAWMIVAAGANLRLFDYYEVSPYVNLILIVGAIVFSFAIMAFNVGERGLFLRATDLAGSEDIRYGVVLCANIVCFAIMIPLVGNALQYISSGGWDVLRMVNYSDARADYMNTIQTYLLEYVVTPCRMATLILGIWMTFAKVKHSGEVLLLAIINSLLYCVVTAGRGPILWIVIFFILVMIIDYSPGRYAQYFKRFFKARYIVLFGMLIVLILLITGDRSNQGDTLGSVIYQYYFSGPVFLTQLLEQDFPGFMIDEDFMLGWATFGFLLNIPLTIGLVLGLDTYTSVYWVGSYLTSGNLPISPELSSNAMCTCYYDFLLDWGTAGAVIGPLLLAFATAMIVHCTFKSRTFFWASIMVYWIQILLRTGFRWDPVDIAFSITIFFLLIFSYKKKSEGHALGATTVEPTLRQS